MSMTVVLVIGAVVASWAVLCVIGGERQRRMQDLEAERKAAEAAAAAAAAAAASAAAEPPARGSRASAPAPTRPART